MNGRQDVEIAAKLLAGEHAVNDPGILAVYWAPADREIRLVEVSESVGDTGEVLPFRFAPDPPDVPFESVVILLGPGDWERVRSGELSLPDGFDSVDEIMSRPPAASNGN